MGTRAEVCAASCLRWCGFIFAALAFHANLAGADCPSAFTPGEVSDIGPNGGACLVADLDGDGNLDLSTGAAAMLGDGNGGFTKPFSLVDEGLKSVFDLIVKDFDDDGRPDLAFLSIDWPQVIVLFGRLRESPDDSFYEAPVRVSVVPGAWHMACADFDENGTLDIVAGSRGMPALSILLNNGDRTFQSLTQEGLPESTHAITVGDFDADGHVDIASGLGCNAMITFGSGDGTFEGLVHSPMRFGGECAYVHRFRAADLDGDGRSDLVVCAGNGICVYSGTSIERGAGLPPEPAMWTRFSGRGRFIELADLSCDGALDIVALFEPANGTQLQVLCGLPPTAEAPIAFSLGNAFAPTFQGAMAVPALGDVNEDGAIDIGLITEGSNHAQVLFGTLPCPSALTAPGDANGDGRRNIGDAIAILAHLFSNKPPRCLDAVEVNGDGKTNIGDAIYMLAYLFAQGPLPVGMPKPCDG